MDLQNCHKNLEPPEFPYFTELLHWRSVGKFPFCDAPTGMGPLSDALVGRATWDIEARREANYVRNLFTDLEYNAYILAWEAQAIRKVRHLWAGIKAKELSLGDASFWKRFADANGVLGNVQRPIPARPLDAMNLEDFYASMVTREGGPDADPPENTDSEAPPITPIRPRQQVVRRSPV
jgi:hypothetical protein